MKAEKLMYYEGKVLIALITKIIFTLGIILSIVITIFHFFKTKEFEIGLVLPFNGLLVLGFLVVRSLEIKYKNELRKLNK